MKRSAIMRSVAWPVLILGISAGMNAHAQVTIDGTRNTQVETATEGTDGGPADVVIAAGATVEPPQGPAVLINSDNTVDNQGTIQILDTNNVTAVELQGGNTGSFTNSSGIVLTEDFTPTDTDNDGTIDGPFAQGSGRTGILISGASPFIGNVTQATTGSITIEGNDSFGFRLAETAGLTGDINIAGPAGAAATNAIAVTGTNAIGVGIEGQVIGNLAIAGNITTRGEGSQAVSISSDIDGQFSNSANINNTGYRFTVRPPINNRDVLDAEDLLQAGAAISINGNVSNGVFLQQVFSTDESGNEFVARQSAISQFGSAPAIIIDGQGTPITIGVVAAITDETDPDFDADLQYAFINQGTLNASGVFNDVNATTLNILDTVLTGGISNTGTLQATTLRSGNDGTADDPNATGAARVIIIGDNVIAERINNTGLIIAQVTEATDEIFVDTDNVVAPRFIEAQAIDIAASSTVNSLTNAGSISAILTGRQGQAIAIRDASGTLSRIDNNGQIVAQGIDSDALGSDTTDFTTIALDASANTTGFTLIQVQAEDADLTDNITPAIPNVIGDVLLGSGDDMVDIQDGALIGDLAFGDGTDALSLTGGSTFTGQLSDTDGLLTVAVSNASTLTQTTADPINVTSASFDSSSTFRPTLNGATGAVSTLIASDTVTLADGASVSPIIENVAGTQSAVFEVIRAGSLTVDGDLNFLSSVATSFLYDTTFALDPDNPNALLITLDLRPTEALGLDTPQSAFFVSAFDALGNNTELANAIVNISDGTEFNQAYNQLLPEFAAAGRQFIQANVDGAVGAVGTHLDNARRSAPEDRTGGAWIEEFAYFADRELAGLSEQYRGFGFGFTGGLDTAWGPFHTVGINLGFASTEIEDVVGVDDPLNIVTLQAGVYAGYSLGNLGIEAYAGGGYNDFESGREVVIGGFTGEAQGDWSATHYNGSLRAGYDVNLGSRFWARPVVSVDYLSLSESAYEETGDLGVALAIDKRTVDVGAATASINLGTKFQGRRTWIRPSIRGGYRTEFINDGVITTGNFAGLNTPFNIEGAPFPEDGFILGFTLAAGSAYSSFALDLDSDIRDGFIRHTGRIVFRLLF